MSPYLVPLNGRSAFKKYPVSDGQRNMGNSICANSRPVGVFSASSNSPAGRFNNWYTAFCCSCGSKKLAQPNPATPVPSPSSFECTTPDGNLAKRHMVFVKRQADLLQIVLAMRTPRRLAGRLNRRHQQSRPSTPMIEITTSSSTRVNAPRRIALGGLNVLTPFMDRSRSIWFASRVTGRASLNRDWLEYRSDRC